MTDDRLSWPIAAVAAVLAHVAALGGLPRLDPLVSSGRPVLPPDTAIARLELPPGQDLAALPPVSGVVVSRPVAAAPVAPAATTAVVAAATPAVAAAAAMPAGRAPVTAVEPAPSPQVTTPAMPPAPSRTPVEAEPSRPSAPAVVAAESQRPIVTASPTPATAAVAAMTAPSPAAASGGPSAAVSSGSARVARPVASSTVAAASPRAGSEAASVQLPVVARPASIAAASAPGTTVAVAVPAVGDALRRLQAIVRELPCADVVVASSERGVSLSGRIARDADRAQLAAAAATLAGPGLAVVQDLALAPATFCSVLQVVAIGVDDPITVGLNRADGRYRDGDFVTFTVVPPAGLGAGHLYVDYVDESGQTIHLRPNELDRQTAASGGVPVRLGADQADRRAGRRDWQVGGAPGRGLVVATFTAEPLPIYPRPEQEPIARWLDDLARARAPILWSAHRWIETGVP